VLNEAMYKCAVKLINWLSTCQGRTIGVIKELPPCDFKERALIFQSTGSACHLVERHSHKRLVHRWHIISALRTPREVAADELRGGNFDRVECNNSV
jgi:hypothetical protein